MSDPSLDALIDAAAAEYFGARERGERIDREAFLKKYASIAEELSAVFSGGDLLDAVLPETQPMNAEADRPPPVALGDLELDVEIGRGGMGVVYRAVQRGLDRTVAVKRIRLSNATTPEDVKRFQFEARAAAKLSHANILPILTFVETVDEVMMVMPFVDGGDLRTKLESGPMAPRAAARVMVDVARGVAHAHAHGIIHRDIKPANIMIGDNGRAVIADFGLAKALEVDSRLTQTGQIVGTPSFMAPEQAAGAASVGPAADVYALGATLYALVVGKPPFQADSPVGTLQLVVEHVAVRPRLLNPNVPVDLQAVIMKCLSKAPDERYASATELAEDLQRFLDGERVRAEPPSLWRRVQNAIGRPRNQDRLQDWGRPLIRIGALIFVTHLLLEILALVGTGWLIPRLAARGVIVLVLGKWLFDWRGEIWPQNPFERAVWALWSGYLIALPVANIGLAAVGRTRGEAGAVESLLAGLAFIATGGVSWGGCYVVGLAFLVLSVPALFISPGIDVAFGVLWLAGLVALAAYGVRKDEREDVQLGP